jgi:hypothetical protein
VLRKIITIGILLCLLVVVSIANADPWKDESGHGKEWNQHWGETPWWGRRKGYWDGHFKHGRWSREVTRLGLTYLRSERS